MSYRLSAETPSISTVEHQVRCFLPNPAVPQGTAEALLAARTSEKMNHVQSVIATCVGTKWTDVAVELGKTPNFLMNEALVAARAEKFCTGTRFTKETRDGLKAWACNHSKELDGPLGAFAKMLAGHEQWELQNSKLATALQTQNEFTAAEFAAFGKLLTNGICIRQLQDGQFI